MKKCSTKIAFVLTVIGACFEVGCRASSQETEPPRSMDSAAPSPMPSGWSSSRLPNETWMLEHERIATAMRNALIASDFREVERRANELGRLPSIKGATPDFLERLDAMTHANARVKDATSASEAGHAIARVARTCADCHARFGGPVRIDVDPPPPRTTRGVDRHMTRHAWATAQMWDGLIRNSEPPWRAGAMVLQDPALRGEELVKNKTPVAEIDRLARAIDGIGKRASETSDIGVRTEILGDLLSTCASCHERTGGGVAATTTGAAAAAATTAAPAPPNRP